MCKVNYWTSYADELMTNYLSIRKKIFYMKYFPIQTDTKFMCESDILSSWGTEDNKFI